MDRQDIIHLSEKGRKQMALLGKLIKKRKFRVIKILTSPETRTVESSNVLAQALNLANKPQIVEGLDDVYAPGAYREGLTMDVWEKTEGNAYDTERWGKYNHEDPAAVIERMNNIFWNNIKSLKSGETAILVSHGDPIAWFINNLITGKIPPAKDLKKLIYPKKGQGLVLIIDSSGKIFSHYSLEDKTLIEGKLY